MINTRIEERVHTQTHGNRPYTFDRYSFLILPTPSIPSFTAFDVRAISFDIRLAIPASSGSSMTPLVGRSSLFTVNTSGNPCSRFRMAVSVFW